AGCADASCPVSPATTISGFPNVNANPWYVAPAHTAVRGITVFAGTTEAFSVRVVWQGGAPVSPPVTISLETYPPYSAFQNGFIPLDIDVPAGALIGVDFTLPVTPAGGAFDDFGGYLWLDQRPQ